MKAYLVKYQQIDTAGELRSTVIAENDQDCLNIIHDPAVWATEITVISIELSPDPLTMRIDGKATLFESAWVKW